MLDEHGISGYTKTVCVEVVRLSDDQNKISEI